MKASFLKRWRVRLIVVAVLAAAGIAWRVTHQPPPPPPPPTGVVALTDITQAVQAAGVLQAKTKVDVGAQVSGQIQTLHVQLGQQVKKGELLVSLDPELARSDVAQAEAALAQARAQLDSSKVDAEAARREVARQRRLLSGQATAAIEAEKAETDLAKIEAALRGQAATVARFEADLDNRKLRLSYTRITAPMDGTVVNLPVQAGQTVIAVQVTPVMLTLADLDTITVRAKVPEADIQSIRLGQTARFSTLSGEGKRYEGKLRVIQPVPERAGNAVFYNVLFDVDNRDRALFSDMTVQVDIETGAVAQVPAIPIVALGERGKDGRFTVQVLDTANKQVPRQVKVGLQDGAKVQVVEGLKAGEKVLLAPPSAADAAASAASS
ncbi:macrolide-specific efflux system membrane fusion protein [Pelomonas aquatica]|uniref:Macrolide-specific efflux system membrane fusion protein n=1 Tax=Pelomonas aquatica TaxID=431058 RepID=A0ABU1Z769_9BURK|nr:efflux RND transporter periplasmic adaptor subunit [Pelomonas aquatica]MDR7296457.1 macrolide-specific efflux system membrane fusion protein [Pelomonas aquatica]